MYSEQHGEPAQGQGGRARLHVHLGPPVLFWEEGGTPALEGSPPTLSPEPRVLQGPRGRAWGLALPQASLRQGAREQLMPKPPTGLEGTVGSRV